MTLDDFRQSLTAAKPPAELTLAAPLFSFTRLYASQASFFEIQNGFASLNELLPSLVGSLN
jgi:hypothetical protein